MQKTYTQKIVELNEQRYGLSFDQQNAIEKLKSELEEFKDATNTDDMLDALCDLVVVSIGEIRKLGYEPDGCMNECVDYVYLREQDPGQKALWEISGQNAGEKWEKDKTQKLLPPNYGLYKLQPAINRIGFSRFEVKASGHDNNFEYEQENHIRSSDDFHEDTIKKYEENNKDES